jgi:hypothetical protein
MGGGNVIEVHSKAEWNAKLAENAGKAVGAVSVACNHLCCRRT